MIQFITVSFISYNVLKNVGVSKEIVELFFVRLTYINISMTILFVMIVFLVMKIYKKINKYAFYSVITGLPNKNYVLNNLIDEISRMNSFSALISLDMDNFKAVNDTLGHLSGDELLNQVGKRIKQIIKDEDCICHVGGDEFLLFIKSAIDKTEVEIIAHRIINVFIKLFIINGANIDYVTRSVGIALISKDGTDFQSLYNCADDAIYSAKKSRKNSYKFFGENMRLHFLIN